MKKFIKFISILLAFTCVFSLFSCKKKKPKNEVELAVLLAGFTKEPYRKLAEAYMAKKKAEGVDVQVKLRFDPEIDDSVVNQMNSNNNLPEIYSTKDLNKIKAYAAKGKVVKLNDLLGTTFGAGYNESNVKVGENYTQQALDECSFNGDTYCLPEYTNVNGFVYNKTLFDKFDWKVPTNTKELKELCEKIIDDTDGEVTPITYCSGAAGGYYYFAVDNWLSLYAGKANMEKFYKFDDLSQYEPTSEISKGKKWAHENFRLFFADADNGGGGYAKDDVTHTMAQANLIMGERAMMLNGSWFENEMKEVLDEVSSVNVAEVLKDVVSGPEDLELGMFRIPDMVVPSGNKPVGSSDALYRAQGYTTEDGKPVIEADSGAYYFIPAEAANVELAVDFLKYLSSDEASVLYTANTNAVRPVNYNLDANSSDYAHMSAFGRMVIDIAKNSYIFAPCSNNPLFIDSKLTLYPRGDYWCKDVLEGADIDQQLLKDYNRVSQNWDKWQKEYFEN